MKMQIAKSSIITSYSRLKGNTKTTVNFYPLFSIPFSMFNFYFSLYMKELGVTNIQIGYLITIGFIASAVASLFSGSIIDKLGRKRFLFIIDGILWPVCLLVRILSSGFWGFAFAAVIGSTSVIGNIAFQFMLTEDADNHDRVTGFNLINVIILSSGVFIPLAGLLVNSHGIITAERGLMAFGMLSFIVMAVVRNRKYTETSVGIKAKLEFREKNFKIRVNLNLDIIKHVILQPKVVQAVAILLCFNLFTIFGTLMGSMYYVPYLTINLGFSESCASLLGSILSVTLLFVSAIMVPAMSKLNIKLRILIGATLLSFSMLVLVTTPCGGFVWMVACNVIYGFGYGIIKPNIDALLADTVSGSQRASVYSLLTLAANVLGSAAGLLSGYLFDVKPVLLFWVAFIFLFVIIIILFYQNDEWFKSSSIRS